MTDPCTCEACRVLREYGIARAADRAASDAFCRGIGNLATSLRTSEDCAVAHRAVFALADRLAATPERSAPPTQCARCGHDLDDHKWISGSGPCVAGCVVDDCECAMFTYASPALPKPGETVTLRRCPPTAIRGVICEDCGHVVDVECPVCRGAGRDGR